MNKLTKAAIAGAAGIALLLGGAGSLAYWNDSANITGSNVTAGAMTITAGTTTTTYADGTAVTLLVPGDVVKVTAPVTIVATGDHMKAKLVVDQALLTGALKPFVTVAVTVQDAAGATLPLDLTNLTAAQAQSIKKIVATVTFPSTTVNKDGQTLQLVLGNMTAVLTQLAP